MNFITNFIDGFTIGGTTPTITYFNGAITKNQLITIIIVVLVCLILLKLVKKGIKFIVLLCAITIIFVNINNFSPSKLISSSTALSTPELKEQLIVLADKSEKIKIENDNISVKIENEWVSLNDIKSLVSLEDGTISLNVDGKDIVITDEKIVSLLKMCLTKVKETKDITLEKYLEELNG